MAQNPTLYSKLANKNDKGDKDLKDKLRYSYKLRLVMIVFTVIFISLFFIIRIQQKVDDTDKYKLSPGFVWSGQTLKADYTFPIYKANIDYKKEIGDAKENTPWVFILDPAVENLVEDNINMALLKLASTTTELNKTSSDAYSEKALSKLISLNQNQKENELKKMDKGLKQFVKKIYKNGFVNIYSDKIESSEILVKVKLNQEYPLEKVNVYDRAATLEEASKYVVESFGAGGEIALELISKTFRPNLIHSEELTEKARQLAEYSISKTTGLVRKGEIIIRKGDIITEDVVPKIKSYQASGQLRDENIYSPESIIGSIGHAIIIYSIMFFYLVYIRRKILTDNVQLSIINVLIVVVAALSWISVEMPTILPIEYLICLPAFSMLAAIVFDSRTAFYVTVTMALTMTGIRGNDYGSGTAMLFSGMLAAYTVKDIQSRTQMFRSIFYIFIGMTFAIAMFGLERQPDLPLFARRAAFALINAATAPLITFGLLFLLERITNIATDLRIKEYDNLNHPLLIKMSESAPGTYQHTLGVAMLAERCARAVNANPLLAKVGAYFHDIGKISKSEYYTENQNAEIGNKHDLITPKRSAATIREHVIDGVQLASQYTLPKRIIDFIPMHHGTTLIKHFYAKALEESSEKHYQVNEEDFRYPGPKPRSKETAILMICDTAEAISRVQNLDKDQIEKLIDQNIKEKLIDGQFDDCNITMSDLQIIKDTISRNLLGKSHQRVKYKEIPKQDDNREED